MAAIKKAAVPGEYYEALIGLLRVAESIWESSRIFFGRWDLSPSQFNILNLLRSNEPGLSQSELSRQLITHRSNMTGLVDRLEKRGLVTRTSGAGDRRAYCVALTREGRRLIEGILPHYYRAVEHLWEGIPTRRALELVQELQPLSSRAEAVAERVERQTPDARKKGPVLEP